MNDAARKDARFASPDDHAAAVTGRARSMFADDIERATPALHDAVSGRRILVVGGGGTIGAVTTELVVEFKPRVVHIVDVSENYLAELVRSVRNRSDAVRNIDFRTLPFDFGGPIMRRFLFEEEPYDIVLNFAALKHVRSEKDVFSLLQMIDTNVVRQARFKRWLTERGGCRRYFAVSTDKAANPASLMGASKRLMEDVLFDVAPDPAMTVTSARFANVAFSNGSLLQSFLIRIIAGHPLAAPRDTRRYFVSRQEAGEICLLASLLGEHGNIYFPDMDPKTELRLLETVATHVLAAHGYEAVSYTDERTAREDVARLAAQGRWPLLLTPLDTSGEKPYEEFLGEGEGEGESEVETPFSTLGALRHCASAAHEARLIEQLENLVTRAAQPVTKPDIVAAIRAALPNFNHVETGRSLDQRV